ncbi:hypothetical protein D7B24_005537 [Verticillium nonalfalfae]|uniref:Uncharacterized protein n=1 Tax=Verticillium nonalfalfae TaxID=1051616 RepID=A0A3M9XYG0_9PEZI|nr:uncharacterized protein D7B24_005537 [Verticillium nonalfalfae]RNJ51930.1 hypothetical protein D7B24_005537 [Verticillium nonalfalfae]
MSTSEWPPSATPGSQTHAGKAATILFPKDPAKQPKWLVEPLHEDWFHRGRVIRLDDKEANGALRGRVLAIAAVSSSHLPQCVSLCKHQNYTGKEAPAHWLSHSVVYSEEQPEPNESDLNRAIQLVMEEKTTKVAPKVFINYEHTWTLPSNYRDNCVEFQNLGHVADDDLEDFVATYSRIQKGLLDRTMESVKTKATDEADDFARSRQ